MEKCPPCQIPSCIMQIKLCKMHAKQQLHGTTSCCLQQITFTLVVQQWVAWAIDCTLSEPHINCCISKGIKQTGLGRQGGLGGEEGERRDPKDQREVRKRKGGITISNRKGKRKNKSKQNPNTPHKKLTLDSITGLSDPCISTSHALLFLPLPPTHLPPA